MRPITGFLSSARIHQTYRFNLLLSWSKNNAVDPVQDLPKKRNKQGHVRPVVGVRGRVICACVLGAWIYVTRPDHELPGTGGWTGGCTHPHMSQTNGSSPLNPRWDPSARRRQIESTNATPHSDHPHKVEEDLEGTNNEQFCKRATLKPKKSPELLAMAKSNCLQPTSR